MEELKKLISEKAGTTELQSQQAIETVATYIKARIPGVLHTSVDKVLAGEDIEDSIKNKAESIGNEIKDKANELGNDLKTAFDKAFKSGKGS